MYYDNILQHSSFTDDSQQNSEILIISTPVSNTSSASKLQSENKLPKYNPSAKHKNTSDRVVETRLKNSGTTSVSIPWTRLSMKKSVIYTSNYSMTKSSKQNEYLSTNNTALYAYNFTNSYKSFLKSENQSMGSISTNVSSLASPMFATNSTSYLDNGLNGDENEPSNDFLPSEGAPVGSGLVILLLLAGSYIIYKNKKVNAFLDKH